MFQQLMVDCWTYEQVATQQLSPKAISLSSSLAQTFLMYIALSLSMSEPVWPHQNEKCTWVVSRWVSCGITTTGWKDSTASSCSSNEALLYFSFSVDTGWNRKKTSFHRVSKGFPGLLFWVVFKWCTFVLKFPCYYMGLIASPTILSPWSSEAATDWHETRKYLIKTFSLPIHTQISCGSQCNICSTAFAQNYIGAFMEKWMFVLNHHTVAVTPPSTKLCLVAWGFPKLNEGI